MNLTAVGLFVHSHAPHSRVAIYATELGFAAIACLFVYARCLLAGATRHLRNGWLVRTVAFAAPMPVYIMLILAPFDDDLVRTLLDDQIVVAIAALFGLVETFKDVRATADEAMAKKKTPSVTPL